MAAARQLMVSGFKQHVSVSPCLSVRQSSGKNCITAARISVGLILWSFSNVCKHIPGVGYNRIIMKMYTLYLNPHAFLRMPRD